MRIAVTGASGLIGSALVPRLRAEGHDVIRMVRRPTVAPDEVRWDAVAGDVDRASLSGLDAAVHLAGAGVGDHRWTAAYKRTIRDSRVTGTRTLAEVLASLRPLPRVLVSGSAIGWYGDTGTRAIDEKDPPADDFLAQVCVDWERATEPAEEAGVRVVRVRTGLVLTPRGGALRRWLPFFRLGLGGRLGSGRQYWSFITLDDEVRAICFALGTDALTGPVNATAPKPATNADVTAAVAAALHRPALLPVPAFALRIALGEFSADVLRSQRVLPRALQHAGFRFLHPDVDTAVRAVLARPAAPAATPGPS